MRSFDGSKPFHSKHKDCKYFRKTRGHRLCTRGHKELRHTMREHRSVGVCTITMGAILKDESSTFTASMFEQIEARILSKRAPAITGRVLED